MLAGCYTSHIKVLEEISQRYPHGRQEAGRLYYALVLEDNLELTRVHDRAQDGEGVMRDLRRFVGDGPVRESSSSSTGSISDSDRSISKQWDVLHLAYMMYVPNLNLKRTDSYDHVVQMIADQNAAVGTSAYLISSTGVDKVLTRHAERGYVDAIPNVMSQLFPESRYAVYPMLFHRAGELL